MTLTRISLVVGAICLLFLALPLWLWTLRPARQVPVGFGTFTRSESGRASVSHSPATPVGTLAISGAQTSDAAARTGGSAAENRNGPLTQLLTDGLSDSVRIGAARSLMERTPESAVRAILAVVLVGDVQANCSFNLTLLRLLPELDGVNDRVAQDLACGEEVPEQALRVVQPLVASQAGDPEVGEYLARAYLAEQRGPGRQFVALLGGPFTRAAELLEARRLGHDAVVFSGLDDLSAASGSLGPLMFLADAPEFGFEELVPSVVRASLNHRDSRRLLLNYLGCQSIARRELAIRALREIESTSGMARRPPPID